MRAAALLAIHFAGVTLAGPVAVELRDSRPATIVLESAVDDAHLANPPGYFPVEPPVARIVERIVIENAGSAPIRDPDVRLNGQPLLPLPDPLAAFGLKDAKDLFALFTAWRDRRIHGSTDLDANRDPLEVMRTFGATFCGDDARALGAITIPHGGEVRFARLNGHSAAEHRVNGEWALLDGDQNAIYLRWDNSTPASAADIVADPMLALRTKIYGRHANWEAPTAWQNASRFEFLETSKPVKTLRLKHPPRPRNWELLPGEKIVIHLDRGPEAALGATEGLRRDAALRSAACLVEFQANAVARHGKVTLPFALAGATGEPVYEAAAEGGPILCQAARAQFPSLRTGRNVVTGPGILRVSFETRETVRQAVPPPRIEVAAGLPGVPRFKLEAGVSDLLWWQIGADREFRLVPPNLDRVAASAPQAGPPGELDATFLSPGGEYFFRAKVRREGVWSDWSEPVAFRVNKPVQPHLESVERLVDGNVRVRWKPMAAGEMMIFGSDRLDFLPEIFAGVEPTRIENGAVREGRPARNLLATVAASQGAAIVPARGVYRMIARASGAISVPSALGRLAGAPVRVLQNRHEKAAGALTGRDVAAEVTIP